MCFKGLFHFYFGFFVLFFRGAEGRNHFMARLCILLRTQRSRRPRRRMAAVMIIMPSPLAIKMVINPTDKSFKFSCPFAMHNHAMRNDLQPTGRPLYRGMFKYTHHSQGFGEL
uniref:Putative secreted protein n=1 Tax=Anopheles marajoara TaxID=58244 RepID=A0A2M4C7U0_9DIPT